jgi:hydroxymethylpyrimidine pyrophosphatase-like HAD family hydrolase
MNCLIENGKERAYRRALALDFDGTIASHGEIRPWAEELLENRVPGDVIRLIVTGRSLTSLRSSWSPPWPIDALIYSSGAGIYSCRRDEIVYQRELDTGETQTAIEILLEGRVDFMIHDPIPDNHCFRYHHEKGHPDFLERIKAYLSYARPFSYENYLPEPSCQLLAVGTQEDFYPDLYNRLVSSGFGVVHTTSPLDGESIWMEIFPKDVSKGVTLSLLCTSLDFGPESVFALGNDYNDYTMLQWAKHAYLVNEAPEELKKEFPVAGSMEGDSIPSLLLSWLKEGRLV